jgi:hypothetical protein
MTPALVTLMSDGFVSRKEQTESIGMIIELHEVNRFVQQEAVCPCDRTKIMYTKVVEFFLPTQYTYGFFATDSTDPSPNWHHIIAEEATLNALMDQYVAKMRPATTLTLPG